MLPFRLEKLLQAIFECIALLSKVRAHLEQSCPAAVDHQAYHYPLSVLSSNVSVVGRTLIRE